jgi:acyl-CoA ligase (AMP-forming) (exosortase A-associated)
LLVVDELAPDVAVASQFALATLAELLAENETQLRAVRVLDRDPAAIFYTSGSTGKSKGVVVSHQNLVSGATCVASYLGNTADDRILCALPMSFDYGFSQVSTAFSVGACAVLTGYSLPAALVRELASERITGLAGVPTMWMHLLDVEWPVEATSQLRYVTNSGGALSATTLRALRMRLPNTDVFCMYGLTEAFRSTYLDPKLLDAKPGSIGRAIPNQEVLVVRPDGTRCDIGEPGELVHRGSLVALGYWNDPDRTALRFRPAPTIVPDAPVTELAVWSGDMVRMDDDGCLYFVARMDQQIKTSGYRVSPDEVQEVILEVEGVLEAVAFGVDDETLGQRIVVALLATRNAEANLTARVHQQCRKYLPAYMVPSDIRIVEAIPRTNTGKPDRAELAVLFRRKNRVRLSLVPVPKGASN